MIWDDYLSEADRERLSHGVPPATAPVAGRRPALLVIDVSWGFAGDDPDQEILDSIRRWPNSCGRESWQAIDRIVGLCAVARDRGLPVLYSTGRARDDAWDIGSWAWKNGRTEEQRPTPDRDANEIVAPLAPKPQDLLVYKRKPSAFFGAPTATHLRRMGCDSVILTGTTTSGCVRATAVDAFSHGFGVCAVEDACFDRAQASHAIALFDIAMRYGAVTGAEEAAERLAAL